MDSIFLADAGAPAPVAPPLDAAHDLAELAGLVDRVDALCAAMVASERETLALHPHLADAHRLGAANLAHYLAARREDLRPLQARLAFHGLSSLGRMEAQALWTVEAVRRALCGLARRDDRARGRAQLDPAHAQARAAAAVDALFGPRQGGRRTRVMVTLPSEAAADPAYARALLDAGMSVARINCAHDDADAWIRMARHVRAAAGARSVRVLADLAGPKLRTGAVASGPGVVHWAPRRDERGSAIAPVRIALASGAAAVAGAPFDALLPVPATWVEALVEGDTIEFVDLRRRPRALGVVRALPGVAVALSYESAWVEAGTELRRRAADGTLRASARVAALPPVERSLRLCPGDRLVLTRDPSPGRAAPTDGEGRALGPAIVPCTLPEAFACARPGEPVWFDDGKIGGRIASVGPDAIEVDITHAKPEGSRLGADKGINLPDTRFDFAGLTAKDRDDLAAVADHVDVLGLSFVDDPDDVRDLWRAIRARTGRALGGMIKIETKRGFARLPEVLLAAMEGYPVGVMIARGDLAVECGFERMAELQEEILWLCEAAHVPVVWATQVLENVAKKGRPTRAEITDAAMAVRAECVMLNKGPHLLAALRVLDDVLRRMEEHQRKKTTLLRPLSVSAREVPDAPAPVSPSA